MSGDTDPPAPPATRRPEPRPLRARFYKDASVDVAPPAAGAAAGYRVLLDGRPIRTPGKSALTLPTRPLADAIAAEWAAQVVHIDPLLMGLTRLANSAIDAVAPQAGAVADDIVKYAESDLLYYRAETPLALAAHQARLWDPVLAEWERRLASRFILAAGIVHVAQPPGVIAAFGSCVRSLGVFELTGLHVMTALTGSALLSLAHAEGWLSLDAAWQAAHADEDWQIAQWGEDSEARARRENRLADMRAASLFIALAA